MRADDLVGWSPIWIRRNVGALEIDWCDLGELRCIDPFFRQTVEAALRDPFNRLFRHSTGPDILPELQAINPGLEPAGFIYHTSRCGSTLVAQMLASLPGTLVIAEADPIEQMLRLTDPVYGYDDEQRITWLRGVVSALGQRRFPDTERYFIKFEAWQTLDVPLLRRAFPAVPWIFLYRDPVEILASHRRTSTGNMMPHPETAARLGLDFFSAAALPLEEYWAVILAAWCRAALEHLDADARLIHYQELPGIVPALINTFWQVPLSAMERQSLTGIAQQDAKNPAVRFTPDSETKRREAPPHLHALAEAYVGPLYERLEAVRHAQLPLSFGDVDWP